MKILLGASGSGKSVLLKLILGLLRPDSGTILVNGYRVSDMSERKLLPIRADIGMLFQESALFDSLTVAENVGYRLYEKPICRSTRFARGSNTFSNSSDSRISSIGYLRNCPEGRSGAWRHRRILVCGVSLDRPLQQAAQQKPPDLIIRSVAGRDRFNFYCASCHGIDAKGAGHVAATLKACPPDLTVLTQHNGGTFPAAKVEQVIRGETQAAASAHGSSDMAGVGTDFSRSRWSERGHRCSDREPGEVHRIDPGEGKSRLTPSRAGYRPGLAAVGEGRRIRAANPSKSETVTMPTRRLLSTTGTAVC